MPRTYSYVVPAKKKKPKTRIFFGTQQQRGKYYQRRKLPAWMLEKTGIHEQGVNIDRYQLHYPPGTFRRGSIERNMRDAYWRTPTKRIKFPVIQTPEKKAQFLSERGKRNAMIRNDKRNKRTKPSVQYPEKYPLKETRPEQRKDANEKLKQKIDEETKQRRIYKNLNYRAQYGANLRENVDQLFDKNTDLDALPAFYQTYHGQHVLREAILHQKRRTVPYSSTHNYQWNPEKQTTEIVPNWESSFEDRLKPEEEFEDPEWTQFEHLTEDQFER